jgi:hypothetical protein
MLFLGRKAIMGNLSIKRVALELLSLRLFSHRKGLKPVRTIIQTESIDTDLRNELWNTLTVYYWNQARTPWLHETPPLDTFVKVLWHRYFKLPIDAIDDYWPKTLRAVREYFYECKWHEVYDLLEFTANHYSNEDEPDLKNDFIKSCNKLLQEEMSAYRFVDGKIAQITAVEEISSIEDASRLSGPLTPVGEHIKRALELLADKKNPDPRNSVKESISAVEAVCRLITGDKNATLGTALDLIEKQGKVKLHPALKGAFDKLYGYASSSSGIRHGTIDDREVDFDIAKYMIVACSAFTNYLIAKVPITTSGLVERRKRRAQSE